MRRLFQLDDRHAAVALAIFSKSEAFDASVALQVLPKRVFQSTRAFAVNQTDTPEIGKHCLVQIFVHGKPCLISEKSAVSAMRVKSEDGDLRSIDSEIPLK